ncbi:MAG: class I SAM-dependent methyltransferase [Janthinobacterium lividum]
MPVYQPPRNWNDVYASSDGYYFGKEPSQITSTAFRFFKAFGGDPVTAIALDLGSGEGRDTAFLAASGMHVVSRDVSPKGLEKTRSLLAQRGIPSERVDLALGDVRDFDYPVETFDLALAANVYQFLTPGEVPGHLARLKAATKPGGICAVGVFSPAMAGWGVDIDGFWTATADELRAYFLEEDGWLLLDRTEYWTYRPHEQNRASFAYVVARKLENDLE